MNPHKITPRRDWILVLEDRRPEKVGSVLLPGNETRGEKITDSAGRVVAIGGGEMIPVLKLAVGDRVIYRGFLKTARPIPDHGETWEDGSNKEYFLIMAQDIMAVIPEGMTVGVFSGRPEVPHRENA